ncbi:MAG TPA: hypothetical protein VGG06_09405 [Thermoanaerobaculia bacterium]|jgi:tRNA A-37 threonylcarbamoyl transferase component Bud32
MAVIQLEVDETLMKSIGAEAVKAFVERQLSLLRLRYLGEKVAQAIHEADFDHDAAVKESREEAWRENKAKFLRTQ